MEACGERLAQAPPEEELLEEEESLEEKKPQKAKVDGGVKAKASLLDLIDEAIVSGALVDNPKKINSLISASEKGLS